MNVARILILAIGRRPSRFHFVAAYADKIPDTYGAPRREPAAAAE
jgi:hypothetical protein